MIFLSQQIWKYILADILAEVKYLPIALTAGLFAGCFIAAFINNKKKALLRTLSIIYLSMVFIITIFEREPGSRTGISLTLFETLGSPRANAYVIENILLFIPFGFFIPTLWKCKRRLSVCLFTGFCFSLAIEIIQLLTERGHFQIDDILMNTIGAGIGAIASMLRLHWEHDSAR